MTHYWWMHWFWITCWAHITFSEATLTFRSNLSVPPSPSKNASNDSLRSAKAIGGTIYNPPTTTAKPSIIKSRISTSNIPRNTTHKPVILFKKVDFLLPHSNASTTRKQQQTVVNNKEMTVINQNNVTDISANITDNQTLINTSLSDLIHSDNLTFNFVDDGNTNQSFVQNSERFGVEVEDGVDVDVNGNNGTLSAAGITGITLGCVIIVGVICAVSYFLYRNRGFNRPQVLNDRCSNPDSSGYIDDASVRDNSEEMYSLDNDSFLNSLEAMTIQNYWTDTVKHTKL